MPELSSRFLPFSRPSIDEADIQEVVRALRSGWITTGPRTAQFEKALAQYLGCQYVVALSSCTAAMHLALKGMDLKPGDEVITTPLTFVATLFAILQAGGVPVLADVEPTTLTLDPKEVARKITSRTRGILPVHYGGHPCQMQELQQLAEEHQLFIVEDAAHAIGASYGGARIGALSTQATCFSFYANKNLAMGEGGALATNDARLAEQAKILSLHGMSRDAWRRYDQNGTWAYDVIAEGFKYNMTDMQAALGLQQLAKLDAMNARRKALASLYLRELGSLQELQLPQEQSGCDSAWHLFPVRIRAASCENLIRNKIIESLKANGIGTSVHFIPVYRLGIFQGRAGFESTAFPVSEKIFWQEISLPLYPGMTDEDVGYVSWHLKKSIRAYT